MQRVFDKYEIVRRLAYGGMGEVFLARQTGEARFDRLVILKSLRPELASDPEVVEEFLEEARLAATLNHPNIVSIYEVGKSQGTYFIAMEYIRGEDLFRLCQECIQQQRWVPMRAGIHIVRDAALGLDAAHFATTPQGAPLRIVHRDVTPRNLMVRTDGVTKVVDFGVAKAIDRASRTITGGLKGTIAYMSPEQALAEHVDPRADQFSLGVVLWELLTQKRLFGGRDSIEVLERVRNHEIEPPSKYNDSVAGALDDVVMRMLERDRDKRFPSCRSAADALGDFLGDFAGPQGAERVAAFVQSVAGDVIDARTADLTPSGVGLVPTEPPRPVEKRKGLVAGRFSPGLVAAAGVSAVAALAVGVFLGRQEPAPEPTPLDELPPLMSVDEAPSPSPPGEEATEPPPAQKAPPPIDAAAPPPPPTRIEPEPPEARKKPKPRPRPRPVVAAASPAGKPPEKAGPGPGAAAETSPPEGKMGMVTVNTAPWTQVTIDGLPRGATPLYRVELSPGPHMVHLVNLKAGVDVWKKIEVKPGQELHVDWKLEGKSSP